MCFKIYWFYAHLIDGTFSSLHHRLVHRDSQLGLPICAHPMQAVQDPATGEVGFNVEVGGYFSIKRNVMSIPMDTFVSQHQVVPFCKALLEVFRWVQAGHPSSSRWRDLVTTSSAPVSSRRHCNQQYAFLAAPGPL